MLHIVFNFILKSPHKLSQSIFLNESLTLCFVYIKTFHLTKISTIAGSIVHFDFIWFYSLSETVDLHCYANCLNCKP